MLLELDQVTDAAAAHEVCPYSATCGNVDVTLTANGHDVS
jgi:organic hydroperoxide reductase OsmC/OhrA